MLFRKEYYCLVAGLKEYTLDSDRKGFDAPALIAEIKEDLSRRDRRTVELLYTYYDIENLIGLRAGREHFSRLGNLSREELQEELLAPSRLPASLGRVIAAFNAADKEGAGADVGEDADMEQSFERNLFAAYYAECARSSSQFLRRWSAFDRTLRNVAAAFAARRRGIPVAEVVVGTGDIESALARSSAADFGIKGEVAYVDQVMQGVRCGQSGGEGEPDGCHTLEHGRRADPDELFRPGFYSRLPGPGEHHSPLDGARSAARQGDAPPARGGPDGEGHTLRNANRQK